VAGMSTTIARIEEGITIHIENTKNTDNSNRKLNALKLQLVNYAFATNSNSFRLPQIKNIYKN